MNLEGKKVLVLGLGLSGEGAAELLLREKARVTVLDEAKNSCLEKRADSLRKRGAVVRLRARGRTGLSGSDLVILSPGIPLNHRMVKLADAQGIPLISELELAYHFLMPPIVAVTGTNGKSTTVVLLERMLKEGGKKCALGGNVGIPLSRLAVGPGRNDAIVAEISSFQLEKIREFKPDVAVFLNISPDHLDRYPDTGSYLEAKLEIFKNQGRGDQAVFPAALPEEVKQAIPAGVERVEWGKTGDLVYQRKGEIRLKKTRRELSLVRLSRIPLPGAHNLDNIMAASTVAHLEGVSPSAIRRAIEGFSGLPHRLEYVGVRAGVRYYDDSKATNPEAVKAALNSFPGPIIWLAGGRNKGFDFKTLKTALHHRVKLALFLGEAAGQLERELGSTVPHRVVGSLEEAVALSARSARPGDTVLLSPGCSSFDMFRNFEERGDVFQSLVGTLEKNLRKSN